MPLSLVAKSRFVSRSRVVFSLFLEFAGGMCNWSELQDLPIRLGANALICIDACSNTGAMDLTRLITPALDMLYRGFNGMGYSPVSDDVQMMVPREAPSMSFLVK